LHVQIATISTVKNIIILISGEGSNMRAIVEAARRNDWVGRFDARVSAVISNRPDVAGLAWASAQNLATDVVDHTLFTNRAAFDEALAVAIERHGPATLVVLAGFMRILTSVFVARYEGRLINIHPSLLPAFTGLNTHQRALAAGCEIHGATVHWVTEALDQGDTIDQARLPIHAGDTAATLASKVRAQEHVLYPAAIERILVGFGKN
jgi:phosphoribosylglycinamide formyltransferase 1